LRECVLFIGTQSSNLYTAVDTLFSVVSGDKRKRRQIILCVCVCVRARDRQITQGMRTEKG